MTCDMLFLVHNLIPNVMTCQYEFVLPALVSDEVLMLPKVVLLFLNQGHRLEAVSHETLGFAVRAP